MFAQYLIDNKGKTVNNNISLSISAIRWQLEELGNPKLHDNWITWMKNTLDTDLERITGHNEANAIKYMVKQIDHGYPVIASVSHANNKSGHIILIYGYEEQNLTDNTIFGFTILMGITTQR